MAGDDVDLVTGLQHRRVAAVADRVLDEGGGRAELAEELGDVESGLVEVGGDPVQGGDLGDRGADGRGEADGPFVVADPGDGRGERAHRVLPVDLGAVAGPALGGQLQPAGAALARRDRVEREAVAGVEGEGPGLADALGAALEEPGVLLGEEAGSVGGAVLLVGGVGDDDVTGRAEPFAGPAPYDGEDHRVHVLHVDGAPPPHDPVADLPGERVHAPVGGFGGHHVEVAVDEQRVGGGVGAGNPGDHVGPAGGALQQGRLDPGVREAFGDVLGGGALAAVAAAPVGGVDPDQLGGERHHFVERLLVHGSERVGGLSHTVPPRRPTRSSSPP